VAKLRTINWYRRIIGFLLYVVVITRLDIAFAVSRLARFIMNLGLEYEEIVNRVLYYLYVIRFLALKLGGLDKFEIYSDALFANNTFDRRSSQAYAIKLFRGLIRWRANK